MLWLPASWFRPLKAAGVKVAEFLPLSQALRLPMNLRTHRKILVVDGDTAFTGGLNVGDEYVGAKGSEAMWRDTHVRITGPAVGSLTAVFLRDWHFMTGQSDVDARFFPEARPAGAVRVAVVPEGPDDPRESISLFSRPSSGSPASGHDAVLLQDRRCSSPWRARRCAGVSVHMILPRRSNHRVTHRRARASKRSSGSRRGALRVLAGMITRMTMSLRRADLDRPARNGYAKFPVNFEVHTLARSALTENAGGEGSSRSRKCAGPEPGTVDPRRGNTAARRRGADGVAIL